MTQASNLDMEAIKGTLKEGKLQFDQIIDELKKRQILSETEAGDILNNDENEKQIESLCTSLLSKGSEAHHFLLEILKSFDTEYLERTSNSGTDGVEQRRIATCAEMSEDWFLKVFLLKLCKHIETDDFNSIKDLVQGESGCGRSIMEKMDRPMKLFRHLMDTGKLNRLNLLYLQCLLWHIDRSDLQFMFSEFAAENHLRPIYFFIPDEKPANGYDYMKFHVDGDLSQFSSQSLEALRTRVSTMLCVPQWRVFVRGIEPAKSITLTFMVPRDSLTNFKTLIHNRNASFAGFGITVLESEEVFTMSDVAKSQQTAERPFHKQLKSLLEREQILETELQKSNERLVHLNNDLEERDKVLVESKKEIEVYNSSERLYKSLFHSALVALQSVQSLHTHNSTSGRNGVRQVHTLKEQSAFKIFMSLLLRAKKHNYDMGLVTQLLDSRSLITSMQESQKYHDVITRINFIVQIFESKIAELVRENQILKATTALVTGFSGSDLQDRVTIQALNGAAFAQQRIGMAVGLEFSVGVQHQVVQGHLMPYDLQLMMTITRELSNRDKNKLRAFIMLNDKEKQFLEEHPERLLEVAYYREVNSSKGNRQFDQIIGSILSKIGRKQLMTKYFEKRESGNIVKRSSIEKKSLKRQSQMDAQRRTDFPGRQRWHSESATAIDSGIVTSEKSSNVPNLPEFQASQKGQDVAVEH